MIKSYPFKKVLHVLMALGCEVESREHHILIEHAERGFRYLLPCAATVPPRHLLALSSHLSQRGILSEDEFFERLDGVDHRGQVRRKVLQ